MNPALLLAFGVGALALTKRPSKSKGRKIVCPPLSDTGGTLAGFDYIEFVTGGANPNAKLPLIVFFHSLASEPKGLAHLLTNLSSPARVVMPRGNEKWGKGPAWWPMRSKDEDQHLLAAYMYRTSRQMVEFIREISQCRPTVGKPILVGHSQGGMMTMITAAANPKAFRGAVAASGWIPTELWPKRLPPMVVLHGTADITVPYPRTKDFLERAIQAGLPIRFIPIQNAGHGLSGQLRDAWKGAIEQMSRPAVA